MSQLIQMMDGIIVEDTMEEDMMEGDMMEEDMMEDMVVIIEFNIEYFKNKLF